MRIEYDGYTKIRSSLTASLRPLFICGYHVSTRRREIKDLLWTQVDLKDNLIILEKRNTKNKQGRALPIYGDMVEALREQKRIRDAEFPDCPYVFFWHTCNRAIGHGGTRMVPGEHIKEFRGQWLKAVTAAGYPELLFHDLRRSAVRNMRKAGMDQKMRMQISGHKTDSMERRYNILVAEDVRESTKLMNDWFQKQKVIILRQSRRLYDCWPLKGA